MDSPLHVRPAVCFHPAVCFLMTSSRIRCRIGTRFCRLTRDGGCLGRGLFSDNPVAPEPRCRRAGTAMPLRRNGDAVAPERPPRSTGTAARCGKNAPVSPRSLPLASAPFVREGRPPISTDGDPPPSRRSTPHLREGQPPSSTEKAGGAPRGVPSPPAEPLEVALYIRSRGSGF